MTKTPSRSASDFFARGTRQTAGFLGELGVVLLLEFAVRILARGITGCLRQRSRAFKAGNLPARRLSLPVRPRTQLQQGPWRRVHLHLEAANNSSLLSVACSFWLLSARLGFLKSSRAHAGLVLCNAAIVGNRRAQVCGANPALAMLRLSGWPVLVLRC